MVVRTVPIVDVEQSLALIEKGQQLAGHFPDAEDMGRARRILTGELSPEAARAEVRDALARLSANECATGRG
ncbi:MULTISPECIES: hypothetical protein [Actinomyces]|uniref:hypothetical protein n=1 Tax=Actinomyces TaxID=1654 RepID=UPI000CA0229A|nr:MULTISPECIES: hypothetical protein [Actinomyces]MBW3068119.1 hypothetical protein [Actinomyces sp. 594]NDR53010.1 hypothetical protein [Actinomyces sp. 565]QHO92007.1 hypothetical protein CWT12_12730 [Actinomyces sp. 432]